MRADDAQTSGFVAARSTVWVTVRHADAARRCSGVVTAGHVSAGTVQDMTDTTTDPTLTPVLSWQRWKRGGGMYANAPGCGQAYSYVRLPTSLHTDAGTYQLTDFHWRHGRTAVVASAGAARELAEQWFAAGPPDDGFARLRAAWGDWHDNVPDGKVGVYVMLPDGSDDSRLIDHDTYLAAMTDDERRIPVGELGDPFDEDATTKAV